MVQFARPISDTTIVGFSTSTGGTASLFAHVDESVADNTDYVQSSLPASVDVHVARLSRITDPGTDTGHVIRYRIGKDTTGGEQIDYTVELRQDYVDEGTKGTLIASWAHVNVSTLSESVRTLSSAEAASITSYPSLYVRSETSQVLPFLGNTYFDATAEQGDYRPFVPGGTLPAWQVVQYQGTVTNSNTTSKTGSRSYKFEVTSSQTGAGTGHDVRVMTSGPQTPMYNGWYGPGWYSFDALIDSGYTSAAWNLTFGLQSGTDGAPSPIGHIGLMRWPQPTGPLQLMYRATNGNFGCYTTPTISGYENNSNGYYFMTAQSPSGITQFHRDVWVHVDIYSNFTRPNGEIQIWQNNVLVMHLQHANLDTFGANGGPGTVDPCNNASNRMWLQMGNYGGPQTGIQRLYLDNVKATDYRVGV